MRTLISIFAFVLVAGSSLVAHADIPAETGSGTGTDTGTGTGTTTDSSASSSASGSGGSEGDTSKEGCSIGGQDGLLGLAALALLLSSVALRRRR